MSNQTQNPHRGAAGLFVFGAQCGCLRSTKRFGFGVLLSPGGLPALQQLSSSCDKHQLVCIDTNIYTCIYVYIYIYIFEIHAMYLYISVLGLRPKIKAARVESLGFTTQAQLQSLACLLFVQALLYLDVHRFISNNPKKCL